MPVSDNLQIGISFALLAGVLWGIGPLLLKRGMTYSNVSTATLIEQYVSVITLTLMAMIRGELFRFAELPSRALWAFVGAGAVGASIGKIFYYKGIDKVGASKATSVKNSSPILTTILAMVLLDEKLTLPVAVGVLLIVFGVLVLTEVDSKDKERPSRIGYFFYPLMAALCFGINPVFKKIGMTVSSFPVLGAFITQFTGLLMMLTAGRLLKIKPRWERVPIGSLLFFALAGVTEALGSLLTFYALIYAPAVLVSPIWRISPLVTFVLARFTLRGIEVVTLRDGVAATFIVGGVLALTQG